MDQIKPGPAVLPAALRIWPRVVPGNALIIAWDAYELRRRVVTAPRTITDPIVLEGGTTVRVAAGTVWADLQAGDSYDGEETVEIRRLDLASVDTPELNPAATEIWSRAELGDTMRVDLPGERQLVEPVTQVAAHEWEPIVLGSGAVLRIAGRTVFADLPNPAPAPADTAQVLGLHLEKVRPTAIHAVAAELWPRVTRGDTIAFVWFGWVDRGVVLDAPASLRDPIRLEGGTTLRISAGTVFADRRSADVPWADTVELVGLELTRETN